MQLQLEFRHELRSSRRLVFENIMDLEHVPVVHRRWFRAVRIRNQRPDYVEYHLTSNFFALKQEILARGGQSITITIDMSSSHHWRRHTWMGALKELTAT